MNGGIFTDFCRCSPRLLVVQFIFGFWCINIFIRVEWLRRTRFINCNITMAKLLIYEYFCAFTVSVSVFRLLLLFLHLELAAVNHEFFYGNQTSRKYERDREGASVRTNSLAWKLTQFGHNNKHQQRWHERKLQYGHWNMNHHELGWCESVRKLTATITVIGIHYLDENLSERKRKRQPHTQRKRDKERAAVWAGEWWRVCAQMRKGENKWARDWKSNDKKIC